MRIILALFFATGIVAAQTPQVPHKMDFAGITLTIRDDARREIQKDVDALTQSPRHHNIKVERARTYFPLIEKVFQQESVPDDFKYLVLQESALVADAVSTSNAVGFWQFKDFTAIEMGLRVDREIDERLNIVSSSRAAARYIKKNNFYFNNWIYALQAYQMGAGGVMKAVGKTENGATHMEITSKTYWYVKKYLAHKVAFEGVVQGAGQVQVLAYENKTRKTLSDLAREVSVDETELKQYNKWARNGTIPDDRQYTVVIPVAGDPKNIQLPAAAVASASPAGQAGAGTVAASASAASTKARIKINGIVAVSAVAGETAAQLASRTGVTVGELAKWNDIAANTPIVGGQYYLLGKKRNRASEASFHKVVAGDNLWKVSQQYGVKINKLKRYNRLSSDADVKPGMTLWLASTKPRDAAKAVAAADVVQVDDAQTFAWEGNPEAVPAVAMPATPTPSGAAAAGTVAGTVASGTSSAGTAVGTPPVATESKTVVETPVVEKAETTPNEVASVQQEAADSAVSTQNIQPATPAVANADSLAATVTIAVVVPENKTEHTVKQGETLYGIAKQYNLGVMDLANWNSLNIQDGIRPGQVLKLVDPQPVVEAPAPAPAPRQVEHEVKSTDTLYSIARKYNVTIKELMEWNNKKDFNLSIGERLKVMVK